MKQTGIWLDYNEANIFELIDGEVSSKSIPSNIEHFNLKGGARSKSPWGPMDKTSDTKLLARKNQQEKQYFESIVSEISDSDEVFVMGPAMAKIGLQKFIEKASRLKINLLKVESADSITTNQKIERVREFFGS